MGFALICRLW